MTYSATEKTGEQDYQGNVATYTYDRSGRVVTANAPISGTLHYQYDAVGNTVAVTTTDSASGVPIQVQTQGYDALNRVITDTVTAPGGPTLTALTAYDKDGNVAQVEQPNGDVTYNTYVASPRARGGRRRGRTPSAAHRAWGAWTIAVTSVPPTLLSLRDALVVLRARWQIDLLFTLWKSQGHIDASRSEQPWRVLCEVFAKLLAMVVQHWLLLVSCWAFPDRSLLKAAQTIRQHALSLASALACPAFLDHALAVVQRCVAAGCRFNRRKKNPNTYQLLLEPSLAGLA